MKAAPMSFAEVFAPLEAWGSENTRRIYARMGAGENQFGVTLGNLRGLVRKLKTNHGLALQLWATGNVDAMILATMLMAPDRLPVKEIEGMVKPLTYYRLIDELVDNVVVKTSHADDLRTRWMDSPKEMIGRAGGTFWPPGLSMAAPGVWISAPSWKRLRPKSCPLPSASKNR